MAGNHFIIETQILFYNFFPSKLDQKYLPLGSCPGDMVGYLEKVNVMRLHSMSVYS